MCGARTGDVGVGFWFYAHMRLGRPAPHRHRRVALSSGECAHSLKIILRVHKKNDAHRPLDYPNAAEKIWKILLLAGGVGRSAHIVDPTYLSLKHTSNPRACKVTDHP